VRVSLTRRQISIGHAALTSQNGVVKCGGAAVKKVLISLAANSENTRQM